MLRILSLCGMILAGAVWAQDDTRTDDLVAALQIAPLVAVISEEGTRHGIGVEADLFPGRGGAGWAAEVARIHDADAMEGALRDGLAKGLSAEDTDTLLAFFGSGLGARIVTAEVEVRRAMLDDGVTEAAEAAAAEIRAEGGSRVDLVAEFIEVLDLIDSNVMGGLNANLAFYQGMDDGGALPRSMGEAEMLNEVWSQEAEIRASTTDWLYTYLLAAYADLTDDELAQYIAFSDTAAGKRFTSVIFEVFDGIFEGHAYALGRAAATYLRAQDI